MTVSNRAAVAVVGIGTTAQGELPGRTADDIAVEALHLALDDAGIAKSDLDGLVTFEAVSGVLDDSIGKLAGLNPAFSGTLEHGQANFSLHYAASAIMAGLCSVVAVLYATNQRTQRKVFSASAGISGVEQQVSNAHGFFNVAGPAAMAFRRHQHLFGTTEEQLGVIAVAQREWAKLNPLAVFQDDLALEDYMASPYIVRPLRRPDLCMISDGGGCFILAASDRVAQFKTTPAYLLGFAQETALRTFEVDDYLMKPWLGSLAAKTYENAGIKAEDIDALYVGEATSLWVLQTLEDYGFCKHGEGGPYLESIGMGPGSPLPVNTGGGHLSESYMQGWLHVVEAVRQLRGEAGARQIPDAKTALFASTGGFHRGAGTVLSTMKP